MDINMDDTLIFILAIIGVLFIAKNVTSFIIDKILGKRFRVETVDDNGVIVIEKLTAKQLASKYKPAKFVRADKNEIWK